MRNNQSFSIPSHRRNSPSLFNYMRAMICIDHVVDDEVTVPWHYHAAGYPEIGTCAVPTNRGTMPTTYDNQQWALPNTAPTALHCTHYIGSSPQGSRHPHHAHGASVSQVYHANSPVRLVNYGYPSGSPAYDTSSLTPIIYAGHHAEGESFADTYSRALLTLVKPFQLITLPRASLAIKVAGCPMCLPHQVCIFHGGNETALTRSGVT